MTQNKTETVTGFIEKLEALHSNIIELVGEIDEVKDLRAIIEQAKAEQSEPVAWLKEWQYDMQDMKRIDFHETCEAWLNALNVKVTPLYTAPQPTPQDVIDAERWRFLNGENYYVVCRYNDTPYGAGYMPVDSDEIDQSMKGE